MKLFHSSTLRTWTAACLALAVAGVFTLSVTGLSAADSTPPATDKAEKKPAKKPEKKKLTGAELYAVNCNRCHPERYPTEFNRTQWKTVMLHMRVRANLPAEQAKAILKYLQEEAPN
ncbi:MAG TPA: hypothetical protein VG167_22005 [Verrucomicrobiae bacterium]|nr:hypothetical protein [Verrucomicrobiae bacterium]